METTARFKMSNRFINTLVDLFDSRLEMFYEWKKISGGIFHLGTLLLILNNGRSCGQV